MKKIFVTGEKGFIGKNLINFLKKNNFNIIENKSQCFDILSSNLLEIDSDVVIHLAAKTFVPDSRDKPSDFYNVNINGTLKVLEYCRMKKSDLIFFSSYIYGVPEYLPIDESHNINPNSPYNHSKKMAEGLCKFYSDNFGINVLILRPFNIYGFGQNKNFLISKLVFQVLKSDLFAVENLKSKRDYLYIDDLFDLLLKVINKGIFKYDVINVGSGISYSVLEIINIINNITGRKMDIYDKKKYRKNEIFDLYADIKKVKLLFDWEPKTTIEKGIESIINENR